MSQSGKLPVLDLFKGQKSGFSPRRQGRLVAPIPFKLGRADGHLVRLAVQNFASIAKGGWECGPKNIKNFHFLVKSRPLGATLYQGSRGSPFTKGVEAKGVAP